MPAAARAENAARHFPRGLEQPAGAFRFSLDALLLAAFFPPGAGNTLLDLGCGCGVVAFGALLRGVCQKAVGLDREEVLLEAARRNAARLGLARAFACARADFRQSKDFRTLCDLFARTCRTQPVALPITGTITGPVAWPAAGFDLVLANPPFRLPGAGRLPANALRRQALFEEPGGLEGFCRTAALALAPAGRCAFLFAASGLPRLERALSRAGLALRRVRPVVTLAGRPPCRVLVEAALLAGPLRAEPLRAEPPLELRDQAGRLTPQALDFCPFLEPALTSDGGSPRNACCAEPPA